MSSRTRRRGAPTRPGALFLFPALAVVAAGVHFGVARAEASRSHQTPHTVTGTAPLAVFEMPTPTFWVPRYDTSGTYLQARGRGVDLGKVNAALRQAVLFDQREYAPYARKAARVA